jgi:DNA-binding IclR family transcriptional regulator
LTRNGHCLPFLVRSASGGLLPSCSFASVLLSFCGERSIRQLARRMPLLSLAGTTPATALLQEIERTRQKGFAAGWSVQGADGVESLAIRMPPSTRLPRLALGIVGPELLKEKRRWQVILQRIVAGSQLADGPREER